MYWFETIWPSAETICQTTVYLPAAPITGAMLMLGPVDGHAAVAVEPVVRILDVEGEAGAVPGKVEEALVGRDDELRREVS